jgi:hypothetical protein
MDQSRPKVVWWKLIQETSEFKEYFDVYTDGGIGFARYYWKGNQWIC